MELLYMIIFIESFYKEKIY